MELTACLLASGIDPDRSVLFTQSSVARHAELSWILTCLATHARLAHLPQYKEKSAKMKEVPLGLLLYPVLQVSLFQQFQVLIIDKTIGTHICLIMDVNYTVFVKTLFERAGAHPTLAKNAQKIVKIIIYYYYIIIKRQVIFCVLH